MAVEEAGWRGWQRSGVALAGAEAEAAAGDGELAVAEVAAGVADRTAVAVRAEEEEVVERPKEARQAWEGEEEVVEEQEEMAWMGRK